MSVSINEALTSAYGSDERIRVLHVQEFSAGSALVPSSEEASETSRIATHSVTLIKIVLRTTGPAPEFPSSTAGTDVGMEIWLPEPSIWNNRVRCQIQGAFMGDFRVTSPEHFSLPICTDLLSGEIASELGYVVATTDGGHSSKDMEDFSYLMKDDGSINREGWKNVAYESTHLLGQKTKELATAYYGSPAKFSYLYGCSSGGRAGYHSAQKYPEDYDGLLIGAPSLQQSFMFPAILHPIIVMENDLKSEPLTPEQIDIVSRKAIAAGDMIVTGEHDGYLTDWESNTYDPTRDHSVLRISDGGNCTESWALSLKQATALNKIWYGPTLDGSVPDPKEDNGTSTPLRENQLFWGKIRGTRIDYASTVRHAATGLLALSLRDSRFASPNWGHPTGQGSDDWRKWDYKEFAEAMLKCRSMNESFGNMDANEPTKLATVQARGVKILTYHGLADTVTNPQISIDFYRRSAEHTGGIEKTMEFHRLFMIPGMDHCIRMRGCCGSGQPPIPTIEELFAALVTWTENGEAPDRLIATSSDGKASRPIVPFSGKPSWAKYVGGDVNLASSYEV